ncbi:Do family serine endopeptidase [Pontibacter sp. BT310]|uniref:Do family serine endopeptidase n=1 Tax=Pontibacter populi TaxID=890055 RepID=A0ABS6X7Q8_9BACT|nr:MULTISPECIES: Do family serine endopeptidase [Pontibacter]MBJ6117179.1 Do family serine endopeptidase [Pontibacter sp. BT310]MBR0569604.1 Do family serine endopeptidase [Microvirga sp. STS03]MBW3364032.1 Do family serine endopeptidase [Pontibacter populi]
MKTKQFIVGLTLSALLGGGVAVGSYKLLEDDNQQNTSQEDTRYPNVRYTSEMRSSTNSVPEGLNFIKAAQVSTPAVVHVMTEYSVRSSENYSSPMDPFLREFFGDGFGERVPRGPQMGSGSGVIVASNGYIVTNNHVIDRADKIEVVLDDKRKFEATLVGTDPNTDLALLKINADKLPVVRYGNSDDLQVGEWVLAVGNPMNLTSTVTAGIVSAKGRNINILRTNQREMAQNGVDMTIESFIQTDAAVNPGNSGGALVNLNGDLVGINTAIASQTGSFAGYSFAVPSAIVSKVVDDLLKYGEVQRALLGANIQEIDAALAKEKGLKTLNGVYIAKVTENSGAKEAGLQEGDIITAINGVDVNKSSQLLEQVARYRPGDKVKVQYLRNGKEKSANVTLKNLNSSTEITKRAVAKAVTFDGATFEPVTKQEMNKLGIDGGAKISGVRNSKFRETGIKDGFIITRIDKYPVNEPTDVEKHLKSFEGGVVYIEGVYPDGLKAYYPIGKG